MHWLIFIVKQRVRGKQIKLAAQRDYNVISNRYLEHHEDKMQVNHEINKAEAAKAFWKTREFDPVSVSYVDGDKET